MCVYTSVCTMSCMSICLVHFFFYFSPQLSGALVIIALYVGKTGDHSFVCRKNWCTGVDSFVCWKQLVHRRLYHCVFEKTGDCSLVCLKNLCAGDHSLVVYLKNWCTGDHNFVCFKNWCSGDHSCVSWKNWCTRDHGFVCWKNKRL